MGAIIIGFAIDKLILFRMTYKLVSLIKEKEDAKNVQK